MIDFQYFQVSLFAISAALVYVLTMRVARWIIRSLMGK